jgi:hypothetical protein
MRLFGIIGTTVLSLTLGAAAPLSAQHEKQDEKKDHSQERPAKHEQTKPAQQHAEHAQQQRQPEQKQQHAQQQERHAQPQKRQEQNKQSQHDQQRHDQPQHAQQRPQHVQPQQRHDQNRPSQHAQQRGNMRRTPEQRRMQHTAWHQHGSQHWETEHRTWQQRGGYRGYRIPDDRFRGHFGRDHGFRISGLPFLVVGGFPRFQYQGFWFSAVDPWPEYWGDDWYDNDDVYVNYVDNGYYLYNRRYPNVGIAIDVSM